jgi:hypothetical protein
VCGRGVRKVTPQHVALMVVCLCYYCREELLKV